MIQIHYLVRLSPLPLMAHALQVKWICIWLLHFSHSEDEFASSLKLYARAKLRAIDSCSKTRELWSSKQPPSKLFFAVVNQNYDHKQRTLKHRNARNRSKFNNQKPWPFEPVEVDLCFPRVPLRWSSVRAPKNANVSWLLNFRIRVFLKIAVNRGHEF